jgi:micrococcal nuclease
MVSKKIGLVLALVLFSTQVSADTITGILVVAHQGDTFTIKSIPPEEKLYKIRLSDIDTPEIKQPFGLKAKEFTETQIIGKEIRVEYSTTDFYGRLIGSVVLPQGKVLNEELVRNGLAWYYRVAPLPNSTFERLQYEAWQNKLGFWVGQSPIPPWEFRRERVFSVPPINKNQMDYDLIFNYGIVGDPKRKIYWWPTCKDYPRQKDNKIIFGYKQLAEDMGYRSSSGCAQ